MKTAKIEEIAYQLKQSKKNDSPKPIVFLGAGASKSAGIPLANEICMDILAEFGDNPRIMDLSEDSRTYARLMDCLFPSERNKLLKDYIDKAKVNVAHLCLAQLMAEDYIDYILTVNFDNLMLRALALQNHFPPTYDMAILKDLTTTSFTEKSVVFLHGCHHGLWLLNTAAEMEKVKDVIPRILPAIVSKRPWIFIGYSGEDPIFEHIAKLGRFDDGLYWVTYNDNDPSEKVCNGLLNNDLNNCSLIKGYDADSFMLALNTKLGLSQPQILEKPFTALQKTLKNIVDIDDKEHYKAVKERLEIDKEYVELAMGLFEEDASIVNLSELKEKVAIGTLKKQIIDVIVKDNYDTYQMGEFTVQANELKNSEINRVLAVAFNNWAIDLNNLAKLNDDDSLFKEGFEKYHQSTILNPQNVDIFNNWGIALADLAKQRSDEALFKASFDKYNQAITLNPQYADAFYNWGNALTDLARQENDEDLFRASFDKYAQATALNPQNADIFNNWGIALADLAKRKSDKALFMASFDKYNQTTILNSQDAVAFYNWGNALADLARQENDGSLFRSSFDKYNQTVILDPQDAAAFNNWGIALTDLAKQENDGSLFRESFDKYEQATILNPQYALAFYNWGTALADLAKQESDEILFKASFDKYEQATILNPQYAAAFHNWSIALLNLIKLKNDKSILDEAIKICHKAIALGKNSYNLACCYALKNDKSKAFELLEKCLKKKETTVNHVETDEDWKDYWQDDDFLKLMEQYKDV